MSEPSYIENKAFWFLRKFADCVTASFLWLVCCIPIVTIGASTSAFYAVIHGAIRRDRDTVWSNFTRVFKKYFRKATTIWLVMFVGLALAVLGWMYTYGAMKAGHPLGAWNPLFFIPMVIIIGICNYIFPYLVRFETDVRHIVKNGSGLAVIHLHWTILMLLLKAVAIVVIVVVSLAYPVTIPFMLFLVPALVGIVDEMVLEKIFRKIMRPEDLQKELKREAEERRDR